MPSFLVSSTTTAATAVAAGQAACGIVSPKAASLAKGVLRTMVLSRCKAVATALLIACVVGAGGVVLDRGQLAQAQTDGAAPRPAARPQDEPPPEPRAKKEPRAPIVVEGEGNRVDYLAWSPDGRMVATVIQLPGPGEFPFHFGVKVWDARTGNLLWTLIETPRGFCSPVTFSPDSKTVAALVDLEKIKLWDAATGEEKATFDVAGDWDCWNLAFSPDGKTLAAVGHPIPSRHDAGYVRLFDAKTGNVLWEQTKAHAERVHALAFSPDGKKLASGSMDLTVKLWDSATGKLLRTLVGHGERGVYRVAFSPDGKTLASGGMDGTCRIWDVDTGELRHTIGGYAGWPMSFVAFSPRDGKTLLTAGYPTDATDAEVGAEQKPVVRLVDLQTGNVPRVVPHSTPRTTWAKRTVPVQGLRFIRDVAFSPDGKTLAIGGEGEAEGKKMKLILQPLED
jgi:WD40 repeat protein